MTSSNYGPYIAISLLRTLRAHCSHHGYGMRESQSILRMPILLSKRVREKGFCYVFDRKSSKGTIKVWRCEKSNHNEVRIHTTSKAVIRKLNGHSHDSSTIGVEVAELVTGIKRRAEECLEATVQVINQLTDEPLQRVQVALQTLPNFKKIVVRGINGMKDVPPASVEFRNVGSA
ncbi:unnamed protein product [Soboliphyme baturini]|uniref:FLYWCH-type domain-containing protein n=1 Tax=Soboliphyme baturini TaxID=241478 RepID=A0A183I9T7_9BILA|nr:unnamed protein product [Soboliphyme baturini]